MAGMSSSPSRGAGLRGGPGSKAPGRPFTRGLGTEHGGRAARGTAWLRVTRGSPGTTAQEETLSPSRLIPRPMAGPASCLLNVEPICKCCQFGSPAGNRLLTISLHFRPSQSQGGGRRPVLGSLGTHRAGRQPRGRTGRGQRVTGRRGASPSPPSPWSAVPTGLSERPRLRPRRFKPSRFKPGMCLGWVLTAAHPA